MDTNHAVEEFRSVDYIVKGPDIRVDPEDLTLEQIRKLIADLVADKAAFSLDGAPVKPQDDHSREEGLKTLRNWLASPLYTGGYWGGKPAPEIEWIAEAKRFLGVYADSLSAQTLLWPVFWRKFPDWNQLQTQEGEKDGRPIKVISDFCQAGLFLSKKYNFYFVLALYEPRMRYVRAARYHKEFHAIFDLAEVIVRQIDDITQSDDVFGLIERDPHWADCRHLMLRMKLLNKKAEEQALQAARRAENRKNMMQQKLNRLVQKGK